MSNVVRQGVEGIGISPSLPTLCDNAYFTEVAIPETVILPEEKPDMEELLSVMVDAKIVSLRIIKTPEGTSQEGQTLTGRKLSIELELKQKVKYIADEPSQSVHAAHFENKVSSIWVVVPKTVNIKGRDVPIETLLLQGKLSVTPYIEDIYGEQLDKRTIFKNITVLINVTFNSCEANLILVKSGPSQVNTNTNFTYKVTIENTGQINARNVIFKDTLTGGSYSYQNNFTVNGVVVAGADPFSAGGVPLDDIPPCETVTITFDVQGTEAATLENTANVTYEYKVCSTEPRTDTSNPVPTTVVTTP